MLGGLINEYRNCSLNPQVNAHSQVLEPHTVDDGDAEPVTAVRAIDGLRITRFG
jgi:hypothetical protein